MRVAWWPAACFPGRGSVKQGYTGSDIALDLISSIQAAGSLPSTLCSSCRENRGDAVRGLQAFSRCGECLMGAQRWAGLSSGYSKGQEGTQPAQSS